MYTAMLLTAGETSSSMSTVLGDVTSVLASAVSWVGTVSSTITSNPLLLLGVVLPFVGFGVGLFKRLLRV